MRAFGFVLGGYPLIDKPSLFFTDVNTDRAEVEKKMRRSSTTECFQEGHLKSSTERRRRTNTSSLLAPTT